MVPSFIAALLAAWRSDNLEYRSVLASSAAILARLPVKLGTVVTGPAARRHAKRLVSHIASGWPDETLKAQGIDPRAIQAARRAYQENRGVDQASALTPDEAVDRLIIAGAADQCVELFDFAARHGFGEIVIGVPLGPDVPEAIDLWSQEILTALL